MMTQNNRFLRVGLFVIVGILSPIVIVRMLRIESKLDSAEAWKESVFGVAPATNMMKIFANNNNNNNNNKTNSSISTHSNNEFNKRQQVVEFERQDRVVIVTKMHGSATFRHLQQSLCLLTYAYNNRLNYDIVAFTTLPLSRAQLSEIKAIVAPATFTMVVDNPGIKTMVANMTDVQRKDLVERCQGVQRPHQISWDVKCRDVRSLDPLSYNWQAEFRTLHLWKHPALKLYKYMLWMDTDGFCSRKWARDPVAMLIQNSLAVLFAHFPAGASRGKDFDVRYKVAFGRYLCNIKMRKGELRATMSATPCAVVVPARQIHGFFHVTDLDFYRSEPVQNWFRILIGNTSRFVRRYDDQIGITVPAAILAGNRSWEMEAHGFRPEVFHNHFLDGKYKTQKGFTNWWPIHASTNFPEAYGRCNITAFA